MFKRFAVPLATLAAFVLLVGMSACARAQTMPAKAPPLAPTPAWACTYLDCSGLFAGASITQIGSQNVGVLNLGAINNSGLYLGAVGGYQLLKGNFLLAVKAQVEYEVYAPAADPLAGTAFKDKLFAFEGIELGGNFAGLFPGTTSTLQLPAWMNPLVTGFNIGGCQHGSKLSGFCAGVSLHYYLPATQWDFHGDVLNAQYGNTKIGPTATTSTETRATAGVTYHFKL